MRNHIPEGFEIDWRRKKIIAPSWETCPRCYCESEGTQEYGFDEILALASAIKQGVRHGRVNQGDI